MLPDTLVKLASFGTSGVCVLIVFWCGRTIIKLGPDTPQPVFKLFRLYLLLCGFIAIISAITGFAVARNTEADSRELLKTLKESKESFELLKANADATNAKAEAAKTAPPTSPEHITPEAAKEIQKSAQDISHEATNSIQNVQKATNWVSKRTGIRF